MLGKLLNLFELVDEILGKHALADLSHVGGDGLSQASQLVGILLEFCQVERRGLVYRRGNVPLRLVLGLIGLTDSRWHTNRTHLGISR